MAVILICLVICMSYQPWRTTASPIPVKEAVSVRIGSVASAACVLQVSLVHGVLMVCTYYSNNPLFSEWSNINVVGKT